MRPSYGGHKPTPPLIAEIRDRRQAPQSSPQDVPPKIRIAVTRLTPHRSGNLLGFASVQVGKWIQVHGLRVVGPPGQRRWVGMPANARESDDPTTGERKRTYFSLIDLPKPWQAEMEAAVLAAWSDYEETGMLPQAEVIGGRR